MKQLRQRFWHWKHRKQDRWWTWTHYCVASPGEWGITWTCAPTTSQRNHSTQAWQAWAAKRQLHFQEAPQHEWQLTKAVFFFFKFEMLFIAPTPTAHIMWKSENVGVSFLLSTCGFYTSNSGHQDWQQAPIPTEPAHLLRKATFRPTCRHLFDSFGERPHEPCNVQESLNSVNFLYFLGLLCLIYFLSLVSVLALSRREYFSLEDIVHKAKHQCSQKIWWTRESLFIVFKMFGIWFKSLHVMRI